MLPYRVGLQQRMVPIYRAPFFDYLAQIFTNGLSVFAGKPRPSESATLAEALQHAQFTKANNIHLFNGRFYLCWQVGLLRWLGEWDPDVLVMEANPRYLHSRAAVRWMRERHRPVVGWGLGTGGVLSGKMEQAVWHAFLSQFDAIISYSQTGADQYQSAGIEPERIFIAPNAVQPAPRDMVRRPDGFHSSGAVICYVGRLQARKRVDRLIKACAAVHASTPLQLWIIGDGPEYSSLINLAKEILPTTQFFGAVHGEGVGELLKKADLFVLPGTGGLAVQEAMSYALPVIVGEADGTQSNLVQDRNGWLLPDDSVESLAQVIIAALADPAGLRLKGEHSFAVVKQEVNLERMAEVFLQALAFSVEGKQP